MGRPSKLSAEQWLIVEKRHVVGGETILSLAKEFGVDESSLRRKIKPTTKERESGVTTLRSLAVKKVAAMAAAATVDDEIKTLPVTKQLIVNDLVSQMRTISGHLAGAAELGAQTSQRLAYIANGIVMTIDTRKKLPEDKLRQVQGLTELSRAAAAMGMALVAANRFGDPANAPPPASMSDLSEDEFRAECDKYGIAYEPPAA